MVKLTTKEISKIERMLAKMSIPVVDPTLQAFAIAALNPEMLNEGLEDLAQKIKGGCSCWHCLALRERVRKRPNQNISGMDLYYRILLFCSYPDGFAALN